MSFVFMYSTEEFNGFFNNITYANYTKVYVWKSRDGTGRGNTYFLFKDRSQHLTLHPHDSEL